MKRKLNKICKEINSILPCKDNNDLYKVKEIIEKARKEIPDFNLYYHRDIYINSGFDQQKMVEISIKSGMCHFEPSDDIEEHIGIIAKYN